MKNKNLISSIFFIGIGVIFLIGALKYKLHSLGNPGSGLFPFIWGIILILLSLILAVSTIRFKEKRKGELNKEKIFPYTDSIKKLLIAIFALFAYGIGFEYLGFLLTTFLFVIFLLKFIEPKRWVIVITIGLTTTLIFYLIFNILLSVQLPKGVIKI